MKGSRDSEENASLARVWHAPHLIIFYVLTATATSPTLCRNYTLQDGYKIKDRYNDEGIDPNKDTSSASESSTEDEGSGSSKSSQQTYCIN
jgi:hypothetical protein